MTRVAVVLALLVVSPLVLRVAYAQPDATKKEVPPHYISRDLINPGAPITWNSGGHGTDQPAGKGGPNEQLLPGPPAATTTLASSPAGAEPKLGASPDPVMSASGQTTREERRRWRDYIETDGDVSVFGGSGEFSADKKQRNIRTGRRRTEEGKNEFDPTIIQVSGKAVLGEPSFSDPVGAGVIKGGTKRAEAAVSATVTATSASADASVGGSAFWVNFKDDKTDMDLQVAAAEFKAHGEVDLKKMKAEIGGEVGIYAAKAEGSHKFDVGRVELMVGAHAAVGAAAGAEGEFDLKKGIARWSWTAVLGVGGGFDFGLVLKEEPQGSPPLVPVGRGLRP